MVMQGELAAVLRAGGSLSNASVSVNPATVSFSPNTITSSDPVTLAITVLIPGGRSSVTAERVEVNGKRVDLSLLDAFGVAPGDTSKSLVLGDVAFPPEIDATLLWTVTTPKGTGVATLNVTTTSNRATYTVVVTDADTGSPLSDIRVYLLDPAGGAMRVATTDAAGTATFVEPEAGERTFLAVDVTGQESIGVASGPPGTVNVSMTSQAKLKQAFLDAMRELIPALFTSAGITDPISLASAANSGTTVGVPGLLEMTPTTEPSGVSVGVTGELADLLRRIVPGDLLPASSFGAALKFGIGQ